jgi:hypothetical protein
MQAWRWRDASTHRRPAFRCKAVASLPPGEWVQDDGDLEFGALQPVGGVDPDLRGGRGGLGEGLADLVGLVAVRDSDCYVRWDERLPAGVPFACSYRMPG